MSARLLAAIALGLGLAVVGSLAIAGSSYTPPAASGGVEGDGTGVTDASAFRSALGLGTAATLTAGTAANNAVQLDGSGRLPAVDGSQLTGISATPSASSVPYAPASGGDWSNPDPTEVAGALDALAGRVVDVEAVTTDPEVSSLADLEWSSGTQIPAYLGSGTASLLPVGSGALNIVQLDADSKLPAVDGSALTGISTSPYAADAWDWTWKAGDGSTGWTLSGSAGIATVGGKSDVMSTGATNPSSALKSVGGAPTGDFELRANIYLGGTSSGTTWTYFDFQAFGKRNVFAFASTGLSMWNSGGQLALFASGRPTAQWVTITIRVYGSSDTTATVSIWLGEQHMGNMRWDGGTNSTADGSVRIGQNTGTTGAMAWVAYRSGINSAPPSYTYRGLGYAPNAAAP